MRSERTMKRALLSSLVLGPALLLAALVAPGIAAAAGPITSTACTTVGTITTCNLWAKTGTLVLPGTTPVTTWGFADSLGGSPSVPGPVLVANQGDSVTVNLTNNLAAATSIVFDGQAMVPDLTGVAAGATKSYTFTAGAPGTYLYEAGLIPGSQYQVEMGMYGMLIVRPFGAPNQAYGDASTAFGDEAVVVLGEVDPALNNSPTPSSFDLRYFAPKYAVVNGVAYSGTAPAITATSGNALLLRYANAGIQHHSIGVLGLRQSVLAADGSEIAFPRGMVAETIAPGQSADVLVALPVTAATSTKYALYDASMTLNNGTASGIGGMLAFIDASGTASGTDTVGPLTSGVSINATTGALAASVSDATTGNANVTAAEFFVDATGAAGSGTAMTGAFVSPTEAVSGTVALGLLSSGSHAIYVHGQDALGNWGSFSSTSLTIDLTGPATSALVLNPNPANGTVAVSLAGTASDATSGNHNVTAAEYTIDGGSASPMNLNITAPTVSITATISASTVFGLANGPHTVAVRSQDAVGNWGVAATVTLNVNKAGPATSSVSANPSANNGSYGQPGLASVRVSATFTSAGGTIASGEGFIDSVGANGTGFQFTATDGVFNAASEIGYADIPLTTINLLTLGNHTIYVHGKDATGNWGANATLTYLIDRTIPTFTAITLAPSPTLGSPITLTVVGATDPLAPAVTGFASGVAGGEYWIDTAPAVGGGTAFTGSIATIPSTTISTGTHTIGARVRDAAGNWSTVTQTATVNVVPDAIFANGFDTGGAPWGWSSRSTNTTARLNVTTGAALVGTRGLQAQGNNTNYVQYNFGTTAQPAWPTYDARFYFRPNGNTSTGKDILAAATSNTFGTTLFHVRYRLSGVTPQVQIQVGATANATWTTILGGTSNNVIEVVWQSGTTLQLYVNGTLSQTLTATTGNVGAVRLGSVTSTGNNTLMYFDAFASKRTVSPLVGP